MRRQSVGKPAFLSCEGPTVEQFHGGKHCQKRIRVKLGKLRVRKSACVRSRCFSATRRLMLDCYLSMIEKLLSQDELLGMRKALRAEARALGDVLVVAINSDRTVRELKGNGRPVFNEHERAEILGALRQVDFVTIFDDVSPRSLIAKLVPDVLVKGGDYGLDEIHGREEVEAAGGRVVSLPFVQGASTSTIIERIKSAKK